MKHVPPKHETLAARIARAGGPDIGEPQPEFFLSADTRQHGNSIKTVDGVTPCGIPMLAVGIRRAAGGLIMLKAFGDN